MPLSREQVVWAYRCLLGREPESEAAIDSHRLGHHSLASLRNLFLTSDEFTGVFEAAKVVERKIETDNPYIHNEGDRRPTILVQNYHKPAITALVRDFRSAGLRPLAPNSNWFYTSEYEANDGIGAELLSMGDYLRLPPGLVLIACRSQECDMVSLASEHEDRIILNVAENHNYYRSGISDLLICPDILTYENYPEEDNLKKLLYFFRPYLSEERAKDVHGSYAEKTVCCFINKPQYWPKGSEALEKFRATYPHVTKQFGINAPDGHLNHNDCNRWMSRSMFTVHFKELEAYGLTCLESMLLGTPVITLKGFMSDKTLGRYFLDENTSIFVDSVEEAVRRATSISFKAYEQMSNACRQRVLQLTSDEKTVRQLKALTLGDCNDVVV